MGDVIKRKLILNSLIAISVFMLMAILCCYLSIDFNNHNKSERQIRIDSNDILSFFERNETSDYKNATFDDKALIVVGIDGTVLYQENMNYSIGKKIDLHKIGGINKNHYSVPIVKEGVQIATLLIDIESTIKLDNTRYLLQTIGLVFLAIALFFVCIMRHFQIIRRDIYTPISQIHDATVSIIKGNTEVPVKYNYEGEIGKLCSDFEQMRDELSESMKRERILKENEKILLASISHDLKTPLAAITSHVEGILLGVVKEPDDIKKYAQIIINRATTLNGMIDDILQHTKSELNQLSIELEEVYTKDYFEEVFQEIKQDAMQKGMKIKFSEIPNVILKLDKRRIEEVLYNLVVNSIKYGKNGGVISIRCFVKETPIRAFAISVKDDGMGIAACDLPFVFDKFYRGDKARTQNISGSGLGLSISKYIVEQHGGKIELDSVLGYGTEVNFYIPI